MTYKGFSTFLRHVESEKNVASFRDKRVGHEVPGVVAVLCEGMGGVGEVKYGLIAAAWSTFTC